MILQEGIDKNMFDIINVESKARVLILAIKGIEYAVFKNMLGFDFEKESERLITIIINGLRKK
ncbi:MAG: hypothetical protein RAP70_08665 [Candidatus Celaenobacter antarcticus]|nr:hypothetical protein [Candidatus Celaenobacter antarcticus]